MAPAMRWRWMTRAWPPMPIGYVNAHGTATDRGDIAEIAGHPRGVRRRACRSVRSKSYFGPYARAPAARIEAWLGIEMMRDGWFAPTANLDVVDPRCARARLHHGRSRASCDVEYLMSNNFAFGGINTSLIFRRA